MKAVKCKDGNLSFITRDETRLFNKIDFEKFCPINKFDERTRYMAEDMYCRNILQKVRKKDIVGFKVYPQKSKIE